MHTSSGKRLLSFLFLAAFLLLRVAGVQAMTHDHENDQQTACELCELMAVAEEHTPVFSTADEVVISPPTIVPLPNENPATYETPLFQISEPSFVYNKPPPTPTK